MMYRSIVMLLCLPVLISCAANPLNTSGGSQPVPEPRPFRLSNLAKSDVSYMTDISMRQMEDMLKEMTVKLYRRNPRELEKGKERNVEVRLDSIFSHRQRLLFDELGHKEEIRAMLLGLDETYEGDRVFAIMAGLTGMVRRAYGYREEFFILNSLNGQSLYNSARNIEVLAWRLRSRINTEGDPLLLTNSRPGEPENLSFERLFGKMIALQDFMAELAATQNNRTITKVVHSVGSFVFLPVP